VVRRSCSESAFGSSAASRGEKGHVPAGSCSLAFENQRQASASSFRVAPNAAKVAGYFAETFIAAAALKVWSLNLAATFSRVGVRNGAKARTTTKIISESPMANFHGMTDHR